MLAGTENLRYDVLVAQERRRPEAPEIQAEISADTADVDAGWGVEEESAAEPVVAPLPPKPVPAPVAAPAPKPVAPPTRARRSPSRRLPKQKPVSPPLPTPATTAPPSGQTEVTIAEDDPIEFDADVARDSMPTLPDANPLQYDVVPESERVTIPPAPRVPTLPRQRRRRK